MIATIRGAAELVFDEMPARSMLLILFGSGMTGVGVAMLLEDAGVTDHPAGPGVLTSLLMVYMSVWTWFWLGEERA